MRKLVNDLYRLLFARKFFYKFNKLLYGLSLRGIGVLNYESYKISGEKHFIEHDVSNIKNSVVLDVGANVGSYAKLIRSSNQDIDIYVFEPHPITYQRLVNNIANLNVKTFNVGVGRAKGMLTLYDYASNDGSSHASLYKEVIEEIHKGNAIAHEVQVISLDDFVIENSIERIGLLKIDTEGHELEVLKGFEKFISQGRVDLIQIEFTQLNIVNRIFFKDFWEFLPNYDFYRVVRDGLIPIKSYDPTFCEIFAYQNIVAKLKTISNY